jgi:hypothetical protein
MMFAGGGGMFTSELMWNKALAVLMLNELSM